MNQLPKPDPDLPNLYIPISKEVYDKAMDGEVFHHHFHPYDNHRILEVYIAHSEKVDEDELEPRAPPDACIAVRAVPIQWIGWERLEGGEAGMFPLESVPYNLATLSKNVYEEESGEVVPR